MKKYAFLLLALAVLTAAAFLSNSSTPIVSPASASVQAPSGVNAAALSSCAVKVTWNQSSPPANPRYDAARNDSGTTVGIVSLGVTTAVESANPLSLSFKDEGGQYWSALLNPGTTHTYYVRVYDVTAGSASSWNGPATVTTPALPAAPGAPVISSVDTASNLGNINISWNAGTVSSLFNTYGRFVVTRSVSTDNGVTYGAFTQAVLLPSSNTFYNDPVFSNDVNYLSDSYEYKIYAREVGGEGCDATNAQQIVNSPASVTVVVPSRPTGLTASFIPTPNREISLAWQNSAASAANVTSLEIFRSLGTTFNPATAVSIASGLPSNTTTYTDASIDVGVQTYAYAVHACTATACSFFSDQASAATGVAVPTDLKAGIKNVNLSSGTTNYNTVDVYLNWGGNIFSRYVYTIQRAVDGGAYADIPAAASLSDQQFANLGGVYNENIPLNHSYSYQIKVQAPNGSSAASTAVGLNANIRYKITGVAWGASAQVVPPDTIPPTVAITVPVNGATVNGVIQLTATASDNVGVTSVRFAVDGSNIGAALTAGPYMANWDTTAVSNGSHAISVVASDAAGNQGTASVTVTVNNVSAPVVVNPPAASTNLVLNSVTDTKANISWTDNSVAPAAATYFDVWRQDIGPIGSKIADQPWNGPTEVPKNTFYSDTGLTPSYIYNYEVQSCNDGGCSGYSNVLMVQTSSGSTDGGGAQSCAGSGICPSGQVCNSFGYCQKQTQNAD